MYNSDPVPHRHCMGSKGKTGMKIVKTEEENKRYFQKATLQVKYTDVTVLEEVAVKKLTL